MASSPTNSTYQFVLAAPVLLPMIWFVPCNRKTRIFISKAISAAETKLILNTNNLELRCYDMNDVYWACETKDDAPYECMDIAIRCQMLGWAMQGSNNHAVPSNHHIFIPSPGHGPYVLVKK